MGGIRTADRGSHRIAVVPDAELALVFVQVGPAEVARSVALGYEAGEAPDEGSCQDIVDKNDFVVESSCYRCVAGLVEDGN